MFFGSNFGFLVVGRYFVLFVCLLLFVFRLVYFIFFFFFFFFFFYFNQLFVTYMSIL